MPDTIQTDSCQECIQRVGSENDLPQDKVVWMCPQCCKTLQQLTEELSRETTRFLIGNVL